jgi:spore protease
MIRYQKHRHTAWLRSQTETSERGNSRVGDIQSPRLDLAVEAHELAAGPARSRALEGIRHHRETDGDIEVSRVEVETEQGAQQIGKRIGVYVTLEAPKLRHRDPDLQTQVARRLADELRALHHLPNQATILVVGLGNDHVTPDALGPLAAERLFVTRHLFQHMPELLDEGYRSVAAVAPGVLGVTGIETSEIVRGLVEHVKPDLVIAIDALASRALSRVNATIQVANNGIHPGSGVGNHRQGLTEETLGVPVIAIGVPTVVDAATIASEAMEMVVSQLSAAVPGNDASSVLGQLSPQEKWQMVRELLEPLGNNLMVTPKEIDEFIEDVAGIVAKGINLALHEGMTMEEAAILAH